MSRFKIYPYLAQNLNRPEQIKLIKNIKTDLADQVAHTDDSEHNAINWELADSVAEIARKFSEPESAEIIEFGAELLGKRGAGRTLARLALAAPHHMQDELAERALSAAKAIGDANVVLEVKATLSAVLARQRGIRALDDLLATPGQLRRHEWLSALTEFVPALAQSGTTEDLLELARAVIEVTKCFP